MIRYYDIEEKKRIGYFVFGFALLILLYRAWSGALVSQLQGPVISEPYVDFTYWIIFLLNIPQYLTGHFIAGRIFDFLLLFFTVGSAFFYKKNIFPILYSVNIFIYIIIFNAYSGHHTHSILGLWIISWPFLFSDVKRFSLAWEGLRYYVCFIYFSAFGWKIVKGSLFHLEQGAAVIQHNMSTYMLEKPDAFLSDVLVFALQHPNLLGGVFVLGMLAEAVFIIGFFTKKYDWILLGLAVLFHTISWFLIDVNFFEFLIISLTLLNWKTTQN